jgi:hypothetical protein
MTGEPYLWFMVCNDDYTGDEDDSPFNPELPAVPAAFLARLRELVPDLARLGRTHGRTLGIYEGGRLRVSVSVDSPEVNLALGSLRVEISDADWVAAWVIMELTVADIDDAGPWMGIARGEVDDPDRAVEETTGWLVEQLGRPVAYREWRHGRRTVARTLRLEDTGDYLFSDGPKGIWRKVDTATEVVRRRLGGAALDRGR